VAVRRVLVGVSALLLAVAVVPQLGAAERPGGAPAATGLPDGVPPAATRPEPRLPEPEAWPFPGGFPRTSGTGRLDRGASLWTDFVYDDHGAATVGGLPLEPAGGLTRGLAPAQGVFSYRDPAARNNGADVFRAGVALGATSTYWRVDWTTLADPDVPIAAWTFDRDSSAQTGVADWPASAGVRSPGIDSALVLSSRGARLLDLATGAVRAALPVAVDRASKSFVVEVPRAVLPVSGTWRVRLGAGVADVQGAGFAATGATARLYNVAFRSVEQEPGVYGDSTVVTEALRSSALVDRLGGDGATRAITGNFWNEDAQAAALAAGDVSRFSHEVDWGALAARSTTPEPEPTGYSVRWYASRLDLGEGVAMQSNPAGDLRPNYLSRVQPYAVYVPTTYRRGTAAPLTWVLHSLGVNHNQFAALNPRLLGQLCEDRGSICATTLGRGPDGWYYDEAEVDFWQVWQALGRAYTLDPERTVMSGYSMGGWASYKLTLEHPDLYAAAMPLAGPARCGSQLGPNGSPPLLPTASGHCRDEGDYTPMLRNARWVPYVIGQGALDQLVWTPGVLDHVRALDSLGYRYDFFLYPGEDHLVWATQDRFDDVVAALPSGPRVRDPGQVSYSWYPNLTRRDLGLGATGAYWISGLRARSSGPGEVASVDARSSARPDEAVTVRRSGSLALDPLPAGRYGLAWLRGPRPPARPELTVEVANVRALSVDTIRAGLRCGTVRVTTDGPVELTLAGLRTVSLRRAGTHVVDVRC
jgi:hypothetical protein